MAGFTRRMCSGMVNFIVLGIVIHLVVDWLLQNAWMADNKANLRHPAGYVHAGLHTLGLMLVFPVGVAVALGIIHLLIDTRVPLTWWRRVFRQTTEGPVALHVAIWGDQVTHILAIAVAAFVITHGAGAMPVTQTY